MNLMNYIPTGAENALDAKQLCNISGYSNVRSMQHEIHRLREQGKLICSSTESPFGYYIPADRKEAARFVHQMESRVREIKRAVKAAKKYTSDLPDDE